MEARPLQLRFKTTLPDYGCPDPKKWRIIAPPVDSTQPLEMKFDEPLDSAMLQRVISVFDPERQLIDGEVQVSEAETVRGELMEGDGKPKSDEKVENMLKRCCCVPQTCIFAGYRHGIP